MNTPTETRKILLTEPRIFPLSPAMIRTLRGFDVDTQPTIETPRKDK